MSPTAEKDLARVPPGMLARVLRLLARLEFWPVVSGAKPLRGGLGGHYRLRTGDWRIIFRPIGADVIVERIDDRKDVYDR
jgi:mRNA-degrading endonuclease RelE of RelBE toxin-antitoxin system